MKKQKINVVTLGCSKNLVDSEVLLNQLSMDGFEVVHDSNETDSDIVVINTCGFIHDAKEESVNTILQFVGAKAAATLINCMLWVAFRSGIKPIWKRKFRRLTNTLASST